MAKMSREIKFRAYVKDIDQLDENEIPHKDNFIYGNLARGGHGYDFITSDMHMFNDGYTNFKWQWMIKKGSAEQFTGLKDKNGKDVYEGNLLKIKYPFSDNYEIGEVKWSNPDAGFIIGNFQFWKVVPKSVVVGNVHEDKDLLGADK
jgi:hypothetical protein